MQPVTVQNVLYPVLALVATMALAEYRAYLARTAARKERAEHLAKVVAAATPAPAPFIEPAPPDPPAGGLR